MMLIIAFLLNQTLSSMSISGLWEPKPALFTPKLLFANCSSFTWVGNGEARSIGDRWMSEPASLPFARSEKAETHRAETRGAQTRGLLKQKNGGRSPIFQEGTLYFGNVKYIFFLLVLLIFITHPPTPMIDPVKARFISGSWEPKPSLGCDKTIVYKLF